MSEADVVLGIDCVERRDRVGAFHTAVERPARGGEGGGRWAGGWLPHDGCSDGLASASRCKSEAEWRKIYGVARVPLRFGECSAHDTYSFSKGL